MEPDVLERRSYEELERLLNDPTVPMQAERIWQLADAVAAEAA